MTLKSRVKQYFTWPKPKPLKKEPKSDNTPPKSKPFLPDQKTWDRGLLLSDPPELNEWRTTRQSKWFKASLEEEVEELKNQWAMGQFTSESIEEGSTLNSEALGRIRGLFYAHDLLTKDEEEEK